MIRIKDFDIDREKWVKGGFDNVIYYGVISYS